MGVPAGGWPEFLRSSSARISAGGQASVLWHAPYGGAAGEISRSLLRQRGERKGPSLARREEVTVRPARP